MQAGSGAGWLDEAAMSVAPPARQAVLSLDETPPILDGSELSDLAPRLTFDSFVVGPANELAAAAALAVAEAPGLAYNPLFIHGGVGLGKTHLLHAIGQHARARNPRLRVRYVAAETFIDDTLSAWRSRDGEARAEVRALYRHNVDLLLVDDVQFLQGKTHIQEEFFHIFNALHQGGKHIVLTCDRFPSELQQFHDRLRSRFEWGLVAEVTPPDRDLRIALVHRKARDMGLQLPIDVGLYLADHLRNNVRELEGALTKLSAHARIGKRAIDLGLARSVLGPQIELPSRNLTAEVIQRVTAQQFGLKLADLKGQKRHRSVVVPRMIAIYLTRKHTAMSYPDIGRAFGGRDHSTAIHACQKIEWQLATHAEVQASVQAIETALGK
jgi:chromosomal replication initiator protein